MTTKWIGADANNYGVDRAGKTVNKIVMHWIVGTLESADATFANPDREASSHYGIGDDEIHQYVREENTAWHAGNLTVNRESIAIEHEGGWLLADGTRFHPTNKTHQTSAELVADICRRYNIPLDREHIRLHNEYRATQCPGSLDVDRIIELAKALSIPQPQPIEFTDQTLIPLKEFGEVELQAVVSRLKAGEQAAKKLEECQGKLTECLDKPVDKLKFQNSFAAFLYNLALYLEGKKAG